MTQPQAFQKARALSPDRLVLATTFAGQCKVAWFRGRETKSFYGRSFEEIFAEVPA